MGVRLLTSCHDHTSVIATIQKTECLSAQDVTRWLTEEMFMPSIDSCIGRIQIGVKC